MRKKNFTIHSGRTAATATGHTGPSHGGEPTVDSTPTKVSN
jgi:hypothetical protein